MNESVLLKISWICIILGLGGLLIYFLLMPTLEKQTLFINDNPVIIEATVEKVRNGETTFITLNPDNIQAVAFENLNLQKGEQIIAKGKYSVYKGEKELIIDRVISSKHIYTPSTN